MVVGEDGEGDLSDLLGVCPLQRLFKELAADAVSPVGLQKADAEFNSMGGTFQWTSFAPGESHDFSVRFRYEEKMIGRFFIRLDDRAESFRRDEGLPFSRSMNSVSPSMMGRMADSRGASFICAWRMV